MPIYEYACRSCGAEVEEMQKFSDPHLTDCPSCGRPDLARKLSRTAFVLKGSGWYADGYTGPSNSKGEGGSGPAKDGGEAPRATAEAPKASEPAKASPEPSKAAETKAAPAKAAESKGSISQGPGAGKAA